MSARRPKLSAAQSWTLRQLHRNAPVRPFSLYPLGLEHRTLKALERRGLVAGAAGGWVLTAAGAEPARQADEVYELARKQRMKEQKQ